MQNYEEIKDEEEFVDMTVDAASWAVDAATAQLKQEPNEMSKSDIKLLFCQFCLKEMDESQQIPLNEDHRQSFFDLTQYMLDTDRFSEFICSEECLQKFENTIQYRNDLIKHQEILELWISSSEQEEEPLYDEDAIVDSIMDEEGYDEVYEDPIIKKQDNSKSKKIKFTKTKKTSKTVDDSPITCPHCEKIFKKMAYYRNHVKYVHENEGRQAMCQHCGKVCKNGKLLRNHIIIHDQNKKYKCSSCPKQFVSSGDLNRHLRVHNKVKPFVCNVCSKAFSQSYTLKLHMDAHNKEGFTCDMCGSIYSRRQGLKLHIVKCVNDREREFREPHVPRGHGHRKGSKPTPVYKCFVENCGRTYTIRSTLGIHIEKAHGIKLNKFKTTCLECQQVFETVGEHAIHVKTHTCKFLCDLCKVRFKTDEKLQAHINKIHQEGEERPFICGESDCGARFKRAAHLESHRINIHSAERRFECEICALKCRGRSDYNAHKRRHIDEKLFTCWLCEFSCNGSSNLRSHMVTVHKESRIYPCKFCNQKFQFSKDLTQHEKDHQMKQ